MRQRTTGALHELLKRNSFEDAVLVCEKKTVTAGTLTEGEFTAIKRALAPLLDIEARNKVKRCSLVPVSIVVAACAARGRRPQTVALLTSLQQVPRVWQLKMEQEQNRARLEVDLVLDEELQEMEEEGVHLAAELSVMMPYAENRDDNETAASWRLASIPPALTKELDAYARYRAEPLNRYRDGSAVVDVTVGNDRATVLRFLGWLHAEKEIAPGLGVFGKVDLSEWVEEWLQALTEKAVKFSSLSNYTNSLIAVTNHVYATYQIDEAIHGMQRTPLDDLIRLRGQCESEAKQQRLFQRRDPNWIEWSQAQQARAKAERAYREKKTAQLQRDWLIIALHTVMPPDRVGVIRKLRLGHSLKRCGDGFVLDLTSQRSHKTSKFYGPSCTTMTPLLNEPLSIYLSALQFDAVEDDTPYLFHPQGDTRRCIGSSQWSAMVKSAFSKHAGIACPPKLYARTTFSLSLPPHSHNPSFAPRAGCDPHSLRG